MGREIGREIEWEVGRLGRFFSIRKSYFFQVKSLILVGTLEKYQFLILIIPKIFLLLGRINRIL